MNTSLEVACSNCGRRYAIDPQLVTENFPCPECQGVVEVGQNSSAVPADSPPLPQAAAQSVGSPVVEREESSVAETRAAKRTGPVGAILVGILLLAGIGLIAGFGVYLAGAMQKNEEARQREQANQKNRGRPLTEESDPTLVRINDVQWAVAGEQSTKLGKVRIRIPQVQFGDVRARDAGGEFKSSGDVSFLKIYLELRNQGLETNYTTWYRDPGDGVPRPMLRDQNENEFDMILFDNAAGVQGHTPSATMEQDSEIQDVIVFALPEEVSIADVKALYLSLPGVAFDVSGAVHFKIPADTITTPQEPSKSGLIGSPLSN